MQLLQLGDEAWREQIHPRRHHLPELHEGGSQLLQREADALRLVELDRFGRPAEVEHLPGALEHPGDADALDEIAQAVPDED